MMPAIYVQHTLQTMFTIGIRKEVRISFQRSDDMPFNKKSMKKSIYSFAHCMAQGTLPITL